MRVLVDFHHSSLLRSLVLLFEGRLGMDVFRPIGLEWFDEGFWAINNQRDTAGQFLDYGSQPMDNTPKLNDAQASWVNDVYWVNDSGLKTYHNACTLEFFKKNQFDYLVASIPQHVALFEDLIREYQPQAKLIVQMGNNWNLEQWRGYNVLASIAPRPENDNVMFYHQEFDLTVFNDTPVQPVRNVYSFVNVIEQFPGAWEDYSALKRVMERLGWKFRSYGGQCPDGNMTGAHELASKMREAAFIFHVKPGGDGYGHIIHNAYAVGRPIITRAGHYRGQLAEQLLIPGTFIDLDKYSIGEVKNILVRLMHDPDGLVEMGRAAANRFDEVVDFKAEAEAIEQWLKTLK